jgi:hypothetical protein
MKKKINERAIPKKNKKKPSKKKKINDLIIKNSDKTKEIAVFNEVEKLLSGNPDLL